VADLFPRVEIGTPGEIIYEPLLLARSVEGTLYLEVHPDVYSRIVDPTATLATAVDRIGARDVIDWDLARAALRTHDGVIRDVSRARSSR
jgi:L,D-transpeptidase ErfK/SrfK